MSPGYLFSARVLGDTQNSRKRVDLTQTPKGLSGPYSLTPRGIDAAVSLSAAGVYALGAMHDLHGPFEVCYVGRDDKDVKSGLRRHIADWYPQFFYQYSHSIKAAFEKECETTRHIQLAIRIPTGRVLAAGYSANLGRNSPSYGIRVGGYRGRRLDTHSASRFFPPCLPPSVSVGKSKRDPLFSARR